MSTSRTGAAPGRLSVGEVARLAGVSPRAVRHYHSIGLLPEPDRDSAGYRRYDGRDVIALVRVVRLRAVGMPIPQIAARVTPGVADSSLPAALRALAEEIDTEITQLQATRDRLVELAQSETFEQPVRTLTVALRGHGLLGPADELRAGEEWAAALIDAVHPRGMPGVLDQASGLFTDPAALVTLGGLRKRFRKLTAETSDAEIDALVDDVAAVVPRPGTDAPLVDIDLMDKLLSDRLNPAQQRFVHRLRQKEALGD